MKKISYEEEVILKKYESLENKYSYNPQDLETILTLLKKRDYIQSCTKENVSVIVDAVNNFLNNIKKEKHVVTLERHETEAEAREYFGQKFISEFDQLLTKLDKQQTIVALHGTRIHNCPQICNNGLMYKSPGLSGTAISQEMAFGDHDMHYQQYESLLNWKHKDYKGLVIIAVPYECYYKEGLWNHFQKLNGSAYGIADYKIDPDFIVGYIDVLEKRIVINPNYSREHNYSKYEKDMELFHEQKDMDNEKFITVNLEYRKELFKTPSQVVTKPTNPEESTIDINSFPYDIEALLGTFKSINTNSSTMDKLKYEYLLKELSRFLNEVQKVLPLLKTTAQVQQEMAEKYLVFTDSDTIPQNTEIFFDDDESIEWDDANDWSPSPTTKKGKSV